MSKNDYRALREQVRKRKTRGGSLLVVLAAFLGAFLLAFYGMSFLPVSLEETVVHTGRFQSYKESSSSKYDSELCLQGGETFYVLLSCESKDFLRAMKEMEPGTELRLCVDPKTDRVLEMHKGEEELLRFSFCRDATLRYGMWWFVFSALLAVLGAALGAFELIGFFRSKTACEPPALVKSEEESIALRHADMDVKCKILLEAKVKGYAICYRRVKSVNELVINGLVYAEKKGVIEFQHALRATVDGHVIVAGLDDLSYSYIEFDGELVNYKERLI